MFYNDTHEDTLQPVERAHRTNLQLQILSAAVIVYEGATGALNCECERVFVPWAQLHSLMVCTGESLQWLPPHMPPNTSGHMVCEWGGNQVSWVKPGIMSHAAQLKKATFVS